MPADPSGPCPLCGQPVTALVAMRQSGNNSVLGLCNNCGEPVIFDESNGTMRRATAADTGLIPALDLISLRKVRKQILMAKVNNAQVP